MGLFVTDHVSCQTEINHCQQEYVTNSDMWSEYSTAVYIARKVYKRENENTPYLTSGTVTELSAMLVERMIC